MKPPTYPVTLSLSQAELDVLVDSVVTLLKLAGQLPRAYPGFRTACCALVAVSAAAGVSAEQLEAVVRPEIGEIAWKAVKAALLEQEPVRAQWLN